MEEEKYIIGIDLGGTKTEAVLLQRDDFKILSRKRVHTGKDNGYEYILGQIKHLVDHIESEFQLSLSKIGIGTPGTLDPKTQTLKNSNTVCLNGMPIKKDLEELLQKEVRMANDANCFALAETRMGVVQEVNPDAEIVFGIIMGTGVGSGIVANGKVLQGNHGIAGEWGHNFLDESGGSCYCGKTGCVETVISGPALEKYYKSISHTDKCLKDIFRNGDPNSHKTIERLHEMFGKAIANVINIIDPSVIVIGGGVGNIDSLYTETQVEIEKHLFNNKLETPLLKPKLGDSAGVFGAAMLCL